MDDPSEKKEPNAQFAKDQRLNDAKQAMAEYEAEAVAIRAKTERLRALRLARDAQLAAQPPVAVVKAAVAKTAPAKTLNKIKKKAKAAK